MLKNKSITLTTSFTENVGTLITNTISSSKFLTALGNTKLPSKFTHIPFADVPSVGDTEYAVGSLEVTKELLSIPATLTDETLEDATFDVGSPLRTMLIAQTVLTLESNVVTSLKANIPATTVTSTGAMATILELLGEFVPTALAASATKVVAVSYATHFALMGDIDSAAFFKNTGILLVPVFSLLDTDVVILMTQGCAVGTELHTLEKERKATVAATTYVVQGTFGAAFSGNYVKRASF